MDNDPKNLSLEGLKLRAKTYMAMDTRPLTPDDRGFIEARLRALLQEIARREEQRDDDT